MADFIPSAKDDELQRTENSEKPGGESKAFGCCLSINDDVSLQEKPGILVPVQEKNESPGFLTATNLNRGTCG
jgi:hypothetical protein